MDTRTILALAAAFTFWSSAFAGIRAALPGYDPAHLALLRYLVASAALVPAALFFKLTPLDPRDIPRILFHGFLGYTVYHVALNFGERTVTAASAGFLIATIPVFMAILAVLMLGERHPRRTWVGIAVSFAGAGTIALAEGDGLRLDLGAALVLLAAVSESFYYVLVSRRIPKYGAFSYTVYTIWAGTLFMLVFFPGLPRAVAEAPASATWAVVYMGVFPGAASYCLWNYAMSRGKVASTASTQFVVPILAVFFGWAWLGEVPGPAVVAGGALALFGVWLVNSRS